MTVHVSLETRGLTSFKVHQQLLFAGGCSEVNFFVRNYRSIVDFDFSGGAVLLSNSEVAASPWLGVSNNAVSANRPGARHLLC